MRLPLAASLPLVAALAACGGATPPASSAPASAGKPAASAAATSSTDQFNPIVEALSSSTPELKNFDVNSLLDASFVTKGAANLGIAAK